MANGPRTWKSELAKISYALPIGMRSAYHRAFISSRPQTARAQPSTQRPSISGRQAPSRRHRQPAKNPHAIPVTRARDPDPIAGTVKPMRAAAVRRRQHGREPSPFVERQAAAVATLSESVPRDIGMRTRRSLARIARSVRPGPSAPTRIATLLVGDRCHRVGQRARRRIGRHRQQPKAVVPQQLKIAWPGWRPRIRHQQGVPHRHPDGAPVQRVGAAAAEHHRVHAEAGRIAEDRAEILVVVDTLEHGDGAGPVEHLRHRQLGRAGRGCQHPAVEVKSHHLGHHVGLHAVVRRRNARPGRSRARPGAGRCPASRAA